MTTSNGHGDGRTPEAATAVTVAGPPLPLPGRERWQPLRAGLVNLYYYEYEEFWFRDGRLLLRGNNGAGKSKVLALTLPFLLDGEISPHRVEPDGDPGKRMEWNLLLEGRYEERLGYTWLELGRLDERGEPVYLTLGCGLKAARGRGIAQRWLFHTDQRVGQELWLATPARTPLTRDRLTEAVGERGQVHERVEAYRRAVDEHLFHLGPDRYDALVTLLIQLRQPQLSKRPNEKALSAALTEALAPVDQAVLHDVAAAFHDLEQQRAELAGLEETRDEVDRFLRGYRRYARIAARRQAAAVRLAHSAYEHTGRELNAKREERETAARAEREAAERLRQLEDHDLPAARATEQELAARPELKDLARAEELAQQARDAAERAARLRSEAEERLAGARDQQQRMAEATRDTRQAVEDAMEAAAGTAARAGIGAEHAALLAPLALPDGPAPPVPAQGGPEGVRDARRAGVTEAAMAGAKRQAEELARRRADAARHVRGLARQADAARGRLTTARQRHGEVESARDAGTDRLAAAEEAVHAAGEALAGAWHAFATSVTELALPDVDTVLPELAAWTETLLGPDPARAAAETAGAAARDALAEARAAALGRVRGAEELLAGLHQERERLERGEHETPPTPHTRPEGVRDGRPGAPLWQLTDFRDEVAAAERAGLEAALEAGGLLDAWVTPDGRLLDAETHDVAVTAGVPVARNLADVLQPAIDHDSPQAGTVSEAVVHRLLAGIGLGADTGESWVSADGRWRLGVAAGAWAKQDATFIGRGAREAARRQRLAALVTEIAGAEQAVAAAEAERSAVERRQRVLTEELARTPDTEALRDAHSEARGAARDLERLEQAVAEREAEVTRTEAEAADTSQARDQAAADLHVPTDDAGLEALLHAVSDYQTSTATLWPTVRGHTSQLGSLASAAGAVVTAEADTAARAEDATAAETAAVQAETRHRTLRDSIGAAVTGLETRLEATRKRISELVRQRRAAAKEKEDHLRRAEQARGQEQQLSERLEEETGRRGEAVAAFQRFAATGLLATAVEDPELPDAAGEAWAPNPAVRLARRVEQALAAEDADDAVWERLQQQILNGFRELAEALSRNGHFATTEMLSGYLVATIRYQGHERDPETLARLLADEVTHRERLLSAREKELLQEHLVNEVASHLQELLSDAEAQVARMNAELTERPTSTGMRLRLRWEPAPDGPAGLATARARLLRQAADAWSPEDRAAVGGFLSEQISAERARNEQGTWLEHLSAAFDYRAWHQFRIERLADGRWRPAVGPASGGERALIVTLPLFAAASAHYRSAHAAAPRLVMLDEAFAGIDDHSRAGCMGLLATFDLDFVMTSEREWGCYPTLPGLAIHHLARRDGIDAVHITRWEWDGHTPSQVSPGIPSLLPPAGDRAEADGHPNGDHAGPDGHDGEVPQLW